MAELAVSGTNCEETKTLVKVKQEKKDIDDGPKKSENIKNLVTNLQHQAQLSELQARDVTVTVAVSTNDKKKKNSALHKSSGDPESKTASPAKTEPPPIDFSSICGAFGWTTIGNVHLPFIMRGEERFVAVRMVECRIISKYADILPWTVFTCTNIKSYYITENEAKLLTEINGYHCHFQFGYQSFSTKDVVVRLSDTVKFYEFLESCRTKLQPGSANPHFKDKCGFILVNMTPVPYIRKGGKKYLPLNMIQIDGLNLELQSEKSSEWDLAYLRFLCYVSNADQAKVKSGVSLCTLEDLQNGVQAQAFEEWWPNMQFFTEIKNGKHHNQLSPSMGSLSGWGNSISGLKQESPHGNDSQNLRDKDNEMQMRHNLLSPPVLGLDNYTDKQSSHSPHLVSMGETDLSTAGSNNAVFPSSLEGLLSMPTTHGYRTLNYQSQPVSTSQANSICEFGLRRNSVANESGLSALATSRPRPFPPPPPLVRLGGNPRISHVVHNEHSGVPRLPTLHPYVRPGVAHPNPSWLARALEAEWLGVNQNRSVDCSSKLDNGMNELNGRLSQRLDEIENATSTSASLCDDLNEKVHSSPENCDNSRVLVSVLRKDSYCQDSQMHSQSREDRLVPTSCVSPRLSVTVGPPPYYPTPPQSSPLQPLTVQVSEYVQMSGMTDVYPAQTNPNSVIDLCSPPPSPELRTAVQPTSPRGHLFENSHLQFTAPGSLPAHVVRLVQVGGHYVLAINIESHNYSVLGVPLCVVMNKFLQGASTQSCITTLQHVFGVKLYDCTRLQQEELVKHKVPVSVGSKLVAINDLSTYLLQLRYLLLEMEKRKNRNCIQSRGPSELPVSKRWCSDDRES